MHSTFHVQIFRWCIQISLKWKIQHRLKSKLDQGWIRKAGHLLLHISPFAPNIRQSPLLHHPQPSAHTLNYTHTYSVLAICSEIENQKSLNSLENL
jgi:hypothetical protein